MTKSSNLITMIKKDLIKLTERFGDELKTQLLQDGEDFVKHIKDDLEHWTKQLANGELSREEYRWLLKSKKDLAAMEALKQQGLAKAKVDQYRVALLESIIGSAFSVIGM